MNDGYILIHRQISENEVWKDKPYTRGQAWIDLIMKANFKDVRKIIKGKRVTIRRGQVLRSVENLAEDWGWSNGKVRRFLSYLTGEKMVQQTGTPCGTLITIENYETFQNPRHSNGTPNGTPNGSPDGSREKERKESKRKEGAFEAPTLAQVSDYVSQMGYKMDPAAFYDYYSETHWRKKNGQLIRDWKASVRTWERREKEFGRNAGQKTGKSNVPVQQEPPKYKELKADPEVDAVPMPEDVREKMKNFRRKVSE